MEREKNSLFSSPKDWRLAKESVVVVIRTMMSAVIGVLGFSFAATAQQASSTQQQARDIYRELIEIDTTTYTGDTARAADAMAARLLGAGFPAKDVQVFKPVARKGNLVARLRGTGAKRPMLLVAHIDVVSAAREEWSSDPFKLIEKDGYFYGRGVSDNKFMAAAFVANLIRYKKEGYKPARDLILVLETDEEVLDRQGHGIRWLLKNQRKLLDAEFALNEAGTVVGFGPKPVFVGVQVAEKVFANFKLEASDMGGHSSMPRSDNAISQMARALNKVAAFQFPISVNEPTRATLEQAAALQSPAIAKDMREVAAGTADAAAAARISSNPVFNAMLRTTCVPTQLASEGAVNAMPVRVRATLQCRMLPGVTVEETLATLEGAVNDSQVSIKLDWAQESSMPSVLTAEWSDAIGKVASKFWPGVPVVPTMSPPATDSAALRNAGIPSFGFDGLLSDLADFRVHGNDERVAVKAFMEGQEALYELVKLLSAP